MKTLYKNRFAVLVCLSVLFVIFNKWLSGEWLPHPGNTGVWFYTGLFMALFSALFIDSYYTSPKNVITNTIPLLLVLVSLEEPFLFSSLWMGVFVPVSFLLVCSLVPLVLYNEEKSEDSLQNIISTGFRVFVQFLGRGKVLFSYVFFFFLYVKLKSQYQVPVENVADGYYAFILVFWALVMLIDPKELNSLFAVRSKRKGVGAIGDVIGVQGKNVFLIKIFRDIGTLHPFDVIKFKYSQFTNKVLEGFVAEVKYLDNGRWCTVVGFESPNDDFPDRSKNLVYKVNGLPAKDILTRLRASNFVGLVSPGSTVRRLRFLYSKERNTLKEGDVFNIQVSIDSKTTKTVYYQVVDGSTQLSGLEGRSTHGYIEGEAIQLGEWIDEESEFHRYGWVPTVNSPIYLCDENETVEYDLQDHELYLGNVPGTSFPSILNLDLAVSHHTAILGVTGSGKSYLARKIIRKVSENTKVFCVDFTGEYAEQLSDLNPVPFIKDQNKLTDIEEKIAKKADTKVKADILKYKSYIKDRMYDLVEEYMNSDNNVTLFEIPDLSNTTFTLEFTQVFIEEVFNYAKKNTGSKICIVLEEAHTIVPETNFLGDLGDYGSSKSLVSKMTQIALQGRKYGVGLLVLAQRTANVSKTVLTQCNTVVCFQAFDETSYNFLENYIGRDMIKAMPNLSQYHAVVSGKGARSKTPMIVDLTDQEDAEG